MKYKYRYVLGIPTPPKHALSFGQTIHRTLRDFHRADLFGKKDLDYLLELYKNHWIDEGYDSKEHKEERFKEGKELLEKYYKKYPKMLGKPIFLEKKFTLKLGETSLIGSIDRVDELKDGAEGPPKPPDLSAEALAKAEASAKAGRRGVEVIDYKTGQPKDQKVVDKDEQLTIYALAARDALGLKPKSLALYYVKANEKVATTRTNEDLDKKREELKETVERIKKSNFEPIPNRLCKFCDYHHICPVYKVGG